jgi:hypothetical protein
MVSIIPTYSTLSQREEGARGTLLTVVGGIDSIPIEQTSGYC